MKVRIMTNMKEKKKKLEELEKKNSNNQISLKGVLSAISFVFTLLYGYFLISFLKYDITYFHIKILLYILIIISPIIACVIGLLKKKPLILIITIILEIVFSITIWNQIIEPFTHHPDHDISTYHS